MTAPVLDPSRSAPARRRAPSRAPVNGAPPLRVLPPKETPTEADQRRLVRQIAVLITVAAALCVFGVVVFHVVLTQNQFRLDGLRDQSVDREAEYDRLRLQVAELEAPERIIAEAQHRLGMITPPEVIYLTPSVDEPSVVEETVSPAKAGDGGSAARTGSAAGANEAGTGWSTVKPHLSQG